MTSQLNKNIHFVQILFHSGLSEDADCAVQWGLVCPSCVWEFVSANPTRLLYPSLSFSPWQPQVSSLWLWIWFCFIDKFLCVIFHLLFSFKIFNWRIVALQCCVGFGRTAVWISHKYICLWVSTNMYPPLKPPSQPHYPTLSVVPYFRFLLSGIMWYLSFSSWLTSLSVMISRSIHSAANATSHSQMVE